MDSVNLKTGLTQLSELANKVLQLKEQIIRDLIEITETPAPPFGEQKRGELIVHKFQALGYNVKTDGIGNVLAWKDEVPTEPVIVSAHLDTVFPDKEIKVEKQGDKYVAPGIGDDSFGLVNLLILAELIFEQEFVSNILFVATVGEEGRGDLRGVKYLFTSEEHANLNTKAFVTIDGTGSDIVVDQGVGSRRYRVHFRGPGGHSFGAFGTVNPAYSLGSFIRKFSKMKTSTNIRSTYSIGVIGGGTSINSIPDHVWVDIDMRSQELDELAKMDGQMKSMVKKAANKETDRRDGEIQYELELVGDRPAGHLPSDSWVREVIRVTQQQFELQTKFNASSTDANVPLSLNVPAISLASIGEAGRAHSYEEWVKISDESLIALQRNLVVVGLLAQK